MHPVLQRFIDITCQYPERTAIVDKNDKNYSYSEFSEYINYCYEKLKNKGVKKSSKILIAIPMSMELYAIMQAVFSLGAIAIFLDPWLKGKQMNKIINQVRPELFIISSKYRWLALFIPATWKIKQWWSVNTLYKSNSELRNEKVSDNDMALVTFTSGTSGMPKGADRTFGFLSAQINVLEQHLKGKKHRIDYTNFPIVGLADLTVGNTIVIPDLNLMKIHKANAEKIIESLKKTSANRLVISPSLLAVIIKCLLKKNTVLAIDSIVTGGAPISFRLIENCIKHFPNTHFEAIYGSTEAEPIAITTFSEMLEKMKDPLKGVYVGKPINDVRIKILKKYSNPIYCELIDKLICKPGEIGEIIVTGSHVNKSYYNNEVAFKENKIEEKDGIIWHRTGDMGYFEGKELYLVGRIHRTMVNNGKEIHPYPLEFFIERNLDIEDTGYLQLESGKFVFCIGKNSTNDKDAIRKLINNANYPLDDIVLFKKDLPRDPRHRSKLDVHRLVKMINL